MIGAVLPAYRALRESGQLRADPDQEQAAARLDSLATALEATRTQSGSALKRFFSRTPPPAPRGLYLWGGVGRGKSMLMDLFFHNVRVPNKRRVHFHAFMLEVHAAIHAYRAMNPAARTQLYGRDAGDDPIPPIARALATSARLLCFDELQVTDVADAMILGRLFRSMLDEGVTMVATSNRAPDDLYKHGLNRELFLPAIALLKEHLAVLPLNGATDFRLARLSGMPVYYTPNGPEATAALSQAFFRLTDFPVEDRANVPSETLDVNGRDLFVPKALKGVAVFSFRRLCDNPLGAADYLAIARRFHTVILVGVPVMGPELRNQARRFVTLIDVLYEHCVKLLCAADAAPDALYVSGDGSFEFERTASRLHEMQSAAYLARGHCAG